MEIGLRRILTRALAGLALALATATAALAAPPLWAVRDADSTIYLFGTMHVLTPEAEWRTAAYDKALAESADVWFEMDMHIDPAVAGALMGELGYDFERPLKTKISGKAMRRLRKAFKDRPDLLPMVGYMQPWAAAMVVMTLPSLKAGQKVQSGADMTITDASAKADKRLRYFETAEQQLHFLADLPEAVQVALLEDTLEGLKGSETAMLGMEGAWVDGDVQTFGPQLVNGMRDDWPELYDALVRRRNVAWADALAKEMAGKGVSMVNVGALHMVGDDGLVALMTARGYTVERVQ